MYNIVKSYLMEVVMTRNVLITGGTRGIGKEMVKLFRSNGYCVAFTYKSSDELAKALSLETGAFAIKADSNIPSDIDNAVMLARGELGSIDILINNAGICGFSMFSDITLDMWQQMMNTNLTSAFLYTQLCIPDMIHNKWGRIINISSMWGITGSSCEVHYSTAKAGLIGMTKALAKELGPSSITVNAIAPGLIDTDMNSSVDADSLRAIVDETPVMREGRPLDVASAALFLASDGASFITGDVLNLSGGYII